MAVKTVEALLTDVSKALSEQKGDAAIQIYEDIADTVKELEKKAAGDGTDWKKKYEENDKQWRDKYTERFLKGDTGSDTGTGTDGNGKKGDDKGEEEEEEKPLTYEALFTNPDGDMKGDKKDGKEGK